VPNVPTDRANVTMTKCAQAPAGWGASGTAANPGKSAVKYEITVDFTGPGQEDVGAAQTTVTVAPGKTVPWTAAGKVAVDKGVSCVLAGVG
jgi:hypothetical protein